MQKRLGALRQAQDKLQANKAAQTFRFDEVK
jgi:hypothetical protein